MNIVSQFIKSIYSPKDIASFRNQGNWKTLLYIFMLSLLAILPSIYYSSEAIYEGYDMAGDAVSELPDFVIENGTLQSEAKEPVTIKEDGFSFILDASGAMDADTVAEMGDGIALLKEELVLSAGGSTNAVSYTMLGYDTLTKEQAAELLENSDSIILLTVSLLASIMLLLSIFMTVLEVFLIALFGLLLSKNLRKGLSYVQVWRMSAYAITLPTVFFFIMDLLQTMVAFGAMLNWFVSLVILLLALKEIPGEEGPVLKS